MLYTIARESNPAKDWQDERLDKYIISFKSHGKKSGEDPRIRQLPEGPARFKDEPLFIHSRRSVMDDVLALVVGFPLLISFSIILLNFKANTPKK